MPASLIDADSLLAVDIGTVSTRAAYFDVVEGHYRFIAAGHAPTTASAPLKDVGEGVKQAIENLQLVTGRKFLDDSKHLIMPAREDSGVDKFSATISAGPAVKIQKQTGMYGLMPALMEHLPITGCLYLVVQPNHKKYLHQ